MGAQQGFVMGGVLIVFGIVGCGGEMAQQGSSVAPNTRQAEGGRQTVDDQGADQWPLVIFLGDSLTAGFGLAEEEAFPALVAEQMQRWGRPIRAVNAGVSGDTSAGGANRLDWLLSQQPDLVVVELGANDGLRGLSLTNTESNLVDIVARSLESGSKVLLVGMRIPPSYGPEYTRGFESIFGRISQRQSVPLIPFLLAAVAAVPDLNQGDGIHPNARGHEVLAQTVSPYVNEILASP